MIYERKRNQVPLRRRLTFWEVEALSIYARAHRIARSSLSATEKPEKRDVPGDSDAFKFTSIEDDDDD
jgi:hypothetical protein